MLRLSKRKILLILAEKDMSIAELARNTGVSANNMSVLLNRGRCFTPTVGKLAKALGVSVAEIVEEE